MKLKSGLGASYSIWSGNGVGLFYISGPTQGRETSDQKRLR